MGQEYRDTVWARLERIAEKLSGLYWYSDFHGFDSGGQDCGCRQRTHEVRYRKIMALLRQVEEDLNAVGFRTLAPRKAVQTELKEREYDLLSDAAKKAWVDDQRSRSSRSV